jgi:hypothetical protein
MSNLSCSSLHAEATNVGSHPLLTSLKLNFVAGRVRIVPARDLSGCPFAGPGVDLVTATAVALRNAEPVARFHVGGQRGERGLVVRVC